MDPSSIATFWSVALLLILAPGADWAFTLGASLRGDAVAPVVGGLVTGYALMTVVVAAGVGALVAGSHGALALVTLLGGGYLVWLGVSTLRRPATAEVADRASRSDRSTFVRGIGVSGLNPKALLLFVALLPQFTDPAAPWPIPAQMAVLGVAFTLTCAAFYSALGSLARRVLHARPSAARAMSRVSGAGMIVIGSALVVGHLHP
ncbi:MAG TPA: LysE family translocator [Pseudonocardia sp.]|nr:LysE family translocator [Pseudonocardia sp.]